MRSNQSLQQTKPPVTVSAYAQPAPTILAAKAGAGMPRISCAPARGMRLRATHAILVIIAAAALCGSAALAAGQVDPNSGVRPQVLIAVLEDVSERLGADLSFRYVHARGGFVSIGTSVANSGHWSIGPTLEYEWRDGQPCYVGEGDQALKSLLGAISLASITSILLDLPQDVACLSVRAKSQQEARVLTGVAGEILGGGGQRFTYTQIGGTWRRTGWGRWIS